MTRTRYEPDFKLRVVREALETRNASVVARRHNLAPNLVARWVRQYSAQGEAAFSAKRRRSQLETPELRDVQRENEQLKKLLGEKDLEIAILRDLLKKTTRP
ncbi:MAG: transposase [Bacteroidota bacterium]